MYMKLLYEVLNPNSVASHCPLTALFKRAEVFRDAFSKQILFNLCLIPPCCVHEMSLNMELECETLI